MPEHDVITGGCPSCGMRTLGLRFDRKGRPYIACDICLAKYFTRVPNGAEKFLALSVAFADNIKAWRPAFDKSLKKIERWRRSLGQPTPAPARAGVGAKERTQR